MKVWIGYEVYFNYCDFFKTAVIAFDDEVKALVWRDDFTPIETEWREYEEMDVV